MLAGGVGIGIGTQLGQWHRSGRKYSLHGLGMSRSRSAPQGERNKKSKKKRREEALTHSTNRREEHSVESCESNHRSGRSGDARSSIKVPWTATPVNAMQGSVVGCFEFPQINIPAVSQ